MSSERLQIEVQILQKKLKPVKKIITVLRLFHISTWTSTMYTLAINIYYSSFSYSSYSSVLISILNKYIATTIPLSSHSMNNLYYSLIIHLQLQCLPVLILSLSEKFLPHFILIYYKSNINLL